MCGWVAIFGRAEHPDILAAATRTMSSRGPDGEGFRVVDDGPMPAAMGHRRLAVLDPTDAGAQPMFDAERGASVVYNGEIYNSPSLRRELESAGVVFRSGTDTEVLLRGWLKWGDRILDRIEGIFSFALFDERQGRVLIARDRLGVKPLYWSESGGVLTAASAPRAILALHPELRGHLDRVALAQFLTLLYVPHPRTPWSAIHKLPPGHAMSMEGEPCRTWRYWSPPDPGRDPVDPIHLRHLVRDATERQLLSDVPVGMLLSGGLDSSMLLELMTRLRPDEDFSTLTAGYEDSAQRLEFVPDDRDFARIVAEASPGVTLTELTIPNESDTDMLELAWHFDDPIADPAAITLYRLAQASETKVLLSGIGGEELFAGYPRHGMLDWAARFSALPYGLRRACSLGASALRGGTPGLMYRHRRNAQKLGRFLGRRDPHYWQMTAQLTLGELRGLMPDTADQAFDELDAQSTPLRSTNLASGLLFDRAQFLPNLNLAYVDKAAMACGVEVRVPLLDERVIDVALMADPRSFLEDGQSKVPLRKAAAGIVAPEILARRKTGFGGPVRMWVKGDLTRQGIDALARVGLAEGDGATKLLDDAVSGRTDSALAVWALACLHIWYECHVASV